MVSVTEEQLNKVYRTTSPHGATIYWEQAAEEYILRDSNRYYVHSSKDRSELMDELQRWKQLWEVEISKEVEGNSK